MAQLPDISAVQTDPKSVVVTVSGFVRNSLQEKWRHEHSDFQFLDRLCDLIGASLDALVQIAVVTDVSGALQGSCTDDNAAEDACVSCLKLARNLCACGSAVQKHLWARGIVAKVVGRVQADWSTRKVPRQRIWCETVPGFVANSVAGCPVLQRRACDELFPLGLAAICALCWSRPQLAFVLVQNVLADEGDSGGGRLAQTPEGHCILFLLLSLLHADDENTANEDQEKREAATREWATIFFSSLWNRGAFFLVYSGVRNLKVHYLQAFLCSMVKDPGGDRPPQGIEYLGDRMCGLADARGLLWHTLQGLLVGQDSNVSDLAEQLLSDDDFVQLAVEEMMLSLAALSDQFSIAWSAVAPTAEAVETLGSFDLDLGLPVTRQCADAQAEDTAYCGLVGISFRELCRCAAELAVAPVHSGVVYSGRFIGAYLVGNVSFLDALHRLRFGDVNRTTLKGVTPSEESYVASTECYMFEQLRLVGNVVGRDRRAQDFVRMTGGLRVLLSHCHADPKLPLLREYGIIAVRNAVTDNEANRQMVRVMIAQRHEADVEVEVPYDEVGLV